MLYRTMPGKNEKLSILGFGCMRLPILDNTPSKIDEPLAIKMVRHAIDNGVNYIDTAFPYHGTGFTEPGQSEPFVAKALKDGYRQKVSIATKLPSWLITSRADMDKLLDMQLNRLETDCIDYYLVHSLNKNFWKNLMDNGILEFLDSAIKAGKIRYAGFSYHDAGSETFKQIVDAYNWTFCQIQYNYIDINYQAGQVGLDYAASKGLGIVIMEPLKGGSLAENIPEEALNTFKNADADRTPAEWALRWLWDNPKITLVLSGMSTMAQTEENVSIAKDAHKNAFSPAEHATIENVRKIFNNLVKVPCTACGYCMPCPVGVDIPGNFRFYNDFHRYSAAGTRLNTRIMYSRLLKSEQQAAACVECGKCETHCPQKIEIRKDLKQVAQTFAG